LLSAAAVAAAVLGPLALVGSSGFLAGTRAVASSPSPIFQPWQLWWFFGHHGPLVHGLFGVPKPGYRSAPAWTGVVSHPLILLVGLALPAALWLRRRATRSLSVPRAAAVPRIRPRTGAGILSARDALLALALLLLLRCVLDTWDAVYYPIPFVLALLAWETRGPAERLPVLALCSSVLAWISFQWLPAHASADAQAAFFLAWTLPLAAVLCASLFRLDRAASSERSWILWCERGQEMTVRALDRLVRTAGAPRVTSSRSSIRTPRRPGR